jgi:hypothetical protein
VLAAVLLAIVAAASAAKVAATRRLADRLDRELLAAEDIARAAEAPIEAWLGERSALVVLADDASTAAVSVFDDAWHADDWGCVLRVSASAFDQRGMLPWDAVDDVDLAGSSGLLVAASAVRTAAERRRSPAASPLGLDLLSADPPAVVWPARVRHPDGPRRFGTADLSPTAANEVLLPSRGAAIGALLATHAEDGAEIVLNPNTVPLDLLERVLGPERADLLQAVRSARGRGEATASLIIDRMAGAARPVRLVASSDLWSIRVDATVGRSSSRWWLTYRRGSNGWELVQRLRIPT